MQLLLRYQAAVCSIAKSERNQPTIETNSTAIERLCR